jgi:hypothetical protein
MLVLCCAMLVWSSVFAVFVYSLICLLICICSVLQYHDLLFAMPYPAVMKNS